MDFNKFLSFSSLMRAEKSPYFISFHKSMFPGLNLLFEKDCKASLNPIVMAFLSMFGQISSFFIRSENPLGKASQFRLLKLDGISLDAISKFDNMKLIKILFSLIFLLFSNNVLSKEEVINLQLKDGIVKIKTLDDKAPNHVQQIKDLVAQGKYDGVVFHRVIDGFMAQTGDVQFGNSNSESFDLRRAGTGGSGKNINAEFNDTPHKRGTLSMARAQDPNSADSQFFICFDDTPHLDGQYTVWGEVIEGMEFVDMIKKGDPIKNGMVDDPDKIIKMWIE